jgi:amino-acid N-acetyltransferase
VIDPISLGPAAKADASAILSLLERADLPTAGLVEHLDETLVARKGDEIVGVAALELYEGGALLRSVVVDAQERGSRLGHRLTESAIGRAARLQMPAVYLLTTTAPQFFPRFGFEVITRSEVPESLQQSVEFTTACPASAVVMRKRLE